MRKARGFLLAGCVSLGLALLLLITFLVHVINSKKEALEESMNNTEEEIEAENPMVKEALAEVEHFKNEYGIEITLDDMLKQIRIRNKYEELYGTSYDLEEVFILEEHPDGELEGDCISKDTWDILDMIDAYVEKYQIDESRFQGMSPEEELLAIQAVYGALEDGENDEKE